MRLVADGDHGGATYHRELGSWLAECAPQLDGIPVHKCLVLPGDGEGIELEEFDLHGDVCGGRRSGKPHAFGSAGEVIAALADRPPEDPWIQEVRAALGRERCWPAQFRLRRSTLEIRKGGGEMFHVTAAANRRSISRYGLDWRKMAAAPGIAGSEQPELPAIFICDSREEAEGFILSAGSPTDVWAVRTDGIWIENGPDGWWIITQPVEPERLELVARDVDPARSRRTFRRHD